MPALISRLLPPIFLSVFLAAVSSVRADVVGTARPQAIPKEVTVLRGQSAEIPLSVATESTNQVEFRIATPPKHGKLGAISYPEGDTRSGLVSYTPPTDSEITDDVFLYKARIPDRVVSEAVPVKIRIVDPAARLVMEKGLSFGRVLMGEEKRDHLQILNEGNGTFDAVVTLPAPWHLPEGASRVVVKPKEAVLVPVVFRPTERGAKRYRLVLQPEVSTGSVDFFGEGYSPISASPSSVQLEWDGEKRRRSARITVTNSTGKTLRVAVFAEARLEAGEDFEIPGQGNHVLELWLPAKDRTAYVGQIALEADGFRELLDVEAPVMPALIEVMEPEETPLSFTHHAGEASEVRTLKLRNSGGTRAFLSAEIPAPYQIAEGRDSLALDPDQELEFHLSMNTARTGQFERELTITGGAETLKFSVKGKVVPKDATLPTVYADVSPPRTKSMAKEAAKPERSGIGSGVVAPWAMEAYLRSVGVEAEPRIVSDTVPKIERVLLKDRTRTRLDLWWKQPDTKGNWTYVVETRWMEVDPADGIPRPVWHPLTGVDFKDEPEGITAVLDGLKPGFEYILRVVVKNGEGMFGDPTPLCVFGTLPPNRSTWWKWPLGVLVVSSLAFGYWLWRKRQLAEA